MSEPRFNRVDTAFLKALRRRLPDTQIYSDPADTWSYGYDNSKQQALPGAVVFPVSTDEVAALMAVCSQYRVPVVARGLASGTTGAAVPLHGAVVIALERMNRILRIDRDNRLAVVQPGVTNQGLQDAAGEAGFFWPPDPTSAAYSTVGGNLACNAGGPRAVKYGTPRDNILGLTAVTADGRILHTGVYTTKGVIGYDLTRLLVGSEGTLAIITEAILKLTPRPDAKRTLRAIYRDVPSAARAVSAIMAQPVTPCALEFIDGAAVRMIRDYAQTDLPEDAGAMLMIEVDGLHNQLDDAATAVGNAARNDGLVELRAAETADEIKALWAARKALSPALRKIAPRKINEDVVVPVSRIPELVGGLDKLAQTYGITIVNFGHAGNGNLHVNLLVDPEDAEQNANAERCLHDVFQLVLDLEGTLSGEHGVGLAKRDYVGMEIENTTLNLMRAIKGQFDPQSILNPDKFFPLAEAEHADPMAH